MRENCKNKKLKLNLCTKILILFKYQIRIQSNAVGVMIHQDVAMGNVETLRATSLPHGAYIIQSGKETVKKDYRINSPRLPNKNTKITVNIFCCDYSQLPIFHGHIWHNYPTIVLCV